MVAIGVVDIDRRLVLVLVLVHVHWQHDEVVHWQRHEVVHWQRHEVVHVHWHQVVLVDDEHVDGYVLMVPFRSHFDYEVPCPCTSLACRDVVVACDVHDDVEQVVVDDVARARARVDWVVVDCDCIVDCKVQMHCQSSMVEYRERSNWAQVQLVGRQVQQPNLVECLVQVVDA